jgi:hypothetical protein
MRLGQRILISRSRAVNYLGLFSLIIFILNQFAFIIPDFLSDITSRRQCFTFFYGERADDGYIFF